MMNEVDSLLSQLKHEDAVYLEQYLRNAPRWLMEEFQVITVPEGSVFIHENDPASTIYILVEGVVTATDLRIEQATYDYMRFEPVEIFGAMEFLADIEQYQTTLFAARECRFLKISKEKFEKWMLSDINALAMQTKKMTKYLVEQNRLARMNLFLQGEDRVALFLTSFYGRTQKDGRATLAMNRAEISRSTALSVRTVNRTLTEMIADHRLKKSGRKLIIDRENYDILVRQLSEKIDTANSLI